MKEIPPIYNEQFSKRLKALRKEKKLTQEKIAQLIQSDDGTYRKIEAGKSNPTFKTLVNLALALEVSLSQLLDLDIERTKKGASQPDHQN